MNQEREFIFMRVAICDDNMKCVALLEEAIEKIKIKGVEIDCFYNGDSLLCHLLKKEDFYYQIYLLDIEMPGTNGLEVAKEIREMDKRAIIIFITSYSNYVYSSFEVLPFRFVNKPVDCEKMEQVMNAAVDYIYSSKKYIFITVEKARIQLCCENIIYFECDKRKINVYTITDDYTFYSKMTDVEKMVDDSCFVRIHVSYLINMDYVKALYLNEVLLNDETILPISKKYRKSLKEQHLKYTKWRMGL